jgi:16S rRNA processing protein RimM
VGEAVVVGRVGRPHGVRGDVTVEVHTDSPERRFAPGARFGFDAGSAGLGPARPGPLVVAASRWHSGRLLLRFAGVDDRDAAEALRGLVLTIDADDAGDAAGPDADAGTPDADTWWDRDLVGLRARTPQGMEIGTVAGIVHAPAGDLLAIESPDGFEHLVPFVREIVPTVEVSAGIVIVDPPPGLLDLNRGPAGSR